MTVTGDDLRPTDGEEHEVVLVVVVEWHCDDSCCWWVGGAYSSLIKYLPAAAAMAAAVALSMDVAGAPHIRSSDVSSGRSSTSLIDMYGARIDRSRSSSSMLRVINASSSSGQPDPFGLHSDGILLPSGLWGKRKG